MGEIYIKTKSTINDINTPTDYWIKWVFRDLKMTEKWVKYLNKQINCIKYTTNNLFNNNNNVL